MSWAEKIHLLPVMRNYIKDRKSNRWWSWLEQEIEWVMVSVISSTVFVATTIRPGLVYGCYNSFMWPNTYVDFCVCIVDTRYVVCDMWYGEFCLPEDIGIFHEMCIDNLYNLFNYCIARKFSSNNFWRKWMDNDLGEKAWQMNT